MPLKISLAKWAAQQFDPAPTDRTLRRWAKAGQIVPAPIKIGRTYYVEPTARHIAEVLSDGRLVNRLRRG